jgi:Fe-S cluster assembly scaffold protein SufB
LNELNELLKAFEESGGGRSVFSDEGIAHLFAEGSKILSSRGIEGVFFDAKETEDGISAKVRVMEGVEIKNPVHLCFGIIHKKGIQRIKMDVRLEKNSSAHFIAHCVFPIAEDVRHIMDAVIEIAEGAEMRYTEAHYHGPFGGIEVIPKAIVNVGKGGRYFADFVLTTGRVGRLAIDYAVEAGEGAVAELTARVSGRGNDEIKIKEKVVLKGANSRGLIKTRIAVGDNASAEVTGITEGLSESSRGHVDCMEIVRDNAVASAAPLVRVTHPLAKVTHEAAIGSIDRRQMETLMAHGLSPEEAVDVIVKGILR